MPVPSTNAIVVLWYILPHEIFGVPYPDSFDRMASDEFERKQTYLIRYSSTVYSAVVVAEYAVVICI